MLVRLRTAVSADVSLLDFSAVIALLKLRIVALLVFVSLVGAIVAAGGALLPQRLLLLALAGALSSAGAAALNQYFERDLDASMPRTSKRPLPAGKVPPLVALTVGVGLITSSLVPAFALGPGSAMFVLAGAFFYVFVYTLWLKRSSSWNVPIGGISGSCAVLTGWFAVRDDFSIAPILMATVLFFWNQSHFWSFAIAKQDEYRSVGVPMLPVVVGPRVAARAIFVNTLLMVIASLGLQQVLARHEVYVAGAALLGASFLYLNARLVVKPAREVAWSNFKFSGIYLLLLFLTMAIASFA